MPKNAEKFVCEHCDFKCSKHYDYNIYVLTRKHKMMTHDDKKMPNVDKKMPNVDKKMPNVDEKMPNVDEKMPKNAKKMPKSLYVNIVTLNAVNIVTMHNI